MIKLLQDTLEFRFPEVHPEARLNIDFQRTLRIPDDGSDYPLPPGLGSFPLRLIDDFAERLPTQWLDHGGVMLPMYQSEALWLNFDGHWIEGRGTSYPFAVKIAAGKINAVTGDPWADRLHTDPQDYMVVPGQPWLDGFSVEKGFIRQFVAMPLGSGYSAEEQLTGEAEFGGLQVMVFPMKREVFERRFPKVMQRRVEMDCLACFAVAPGEVAGGDMGLAPGGRMRQEIYEDPYAFTDWDRTHTGRCFVHLANSLVWRSTTGTEPPTVPPTSAEYTRMGLPWFDYYDEKTPALVGSKRLEGLESVAQMAERRGDKPLPENESVTPERIVELRRRMGKDEVRESRF